MKKLLAATAITAAAQMGFAQTAAAQGMPPIQDGFHTNGEVLLTYGNTHYGDSDILGLGRLNFSGATAVGDMRATVRGELVIRSDADDLPADMDDPLNVELALETAYGTFGYSTYHRCAGVGFPWTDGDVGNLGSANIHPWVPGTYRCAGGIAVYAGEGGLGGDDHFFYRNQLGGLSVNAWYDHDLNYENIDRRGVDTLDGEDAPKFEAEVAYDFGPLRAFAGKNDVGDYKLGFSAPVGQTGVNVSYEYNHLDAATVMTGHVLTAMYMPKNPGILRVIRADAWHVESETGDTYDNWMVDVRFGQGDWELGIGYEGQGNIAVEGAYKVTDNLSLVAGFDNGFDDGDGWSAAYGPPTAVPSREGSYEIGLKMSF